jgi:hypothetical protein
MQLLSGPTLSVLVAFAISEFSANAQCPAVGNDTGCGIVITITNSGASVVPTGQGPYDGIDDTLIGVVNNSNQPIRVIGLTSAVTTNGGIFGFDGDGLTTYGVGGNSKDSTGYGGPNAYFTNINVAKTSGLVNFITPIPPNGGTGFFALENALNAATACPQIINNSVPKPAGGGTSISTTFTPNLGLTISQAASYCGFTDFDWIQMFTHLPDPSPYYAVNPQNPSNPVHLTSASTPFNDPAKNGYTYNPAWNSFPFYWDANSTNQPWSLAKNKTTNTLTSYDAPSDPCLPGGNSAGVQGCNGSNAPAGSYLGFTTDLAGILPNGSGVDLGIGYTWTSNYNGKNGGIAVTASFTPVDPGSGTGSITVTGYQPTTNYQYAGGITVTVVNDAAPGSAPTNLSAPPSLILVLIGLAGAIMYFLRCKRAHVA